MASLRKLSKTQSKTFPTIFVEEECSISDFIPIGIREAILKSNPIHAKKRGRIPKNTYYSVSITDHLPRLNCTWEDSWILSNLPHLVYKWFVVMIATTILLLGDVIRCSVHLWYISIFGWWMKFTSEWLLYQGVIALPSFSEYVLSVIVSNILVRWISIAATFSKWISIFLIIFYVVSLFINLPRHKFGLYLERFILCMLFGNGSIWWSIIHYFMLLGFSRIGRILFYRRLRKNQVESC